MALSKVNPKSRFVAGEAERVALEKLSNSEWFCDAVAAALASYVRDLTTTDWKHGDPDADAKFHAIRGAREFSEILLTMADRPKSSDAPANGILNHNLS